MHVQYIPGWWEPDAERCPGRPGVWGVPHPASGQWRLLLLLGLPPAHLLISACLCQGLELCGKSGCLGCLVLLLRGPLLLRKLLLLLLRVLWLLLLLLELLALLPLELLPLELLCRPLLALRLQLPLLPSRLALQNLPFFWRWLSAHILHHLS